MAYTLGVYMTELFKATTATSHIPHYFGDIVRRLFIVNGVIVLIALPVFKHFLPISSLASTSAIVFLIIFAAMTNPLLPWVNKTNVAISVIGLLIFENLAIVSYGIVAFEQSLVYQVLSAIFFFSLYFSVKTFRAMAIGQITAQTVQDAAIAEAETGKDNADLLAEVQRDDYSDRSA